MFVDSAANKSKGYIAITTTKFGQHLSEDGSIEQALVRAQQLRS
jgi:hypothetical protein